ncbi:MAG: type II/IV secretion system protein [Candidatus Taylorbacteria bacterium]|nr:type II/IV secretion system protein [Candidatus Taylorbacteria bacterium]
MPTPDPKTMSAEDFITEVFDLAIKERASDVHFEAQTNSMRIRFRIDGLLEDRFTLPTTQLESVVNSIKVLANLDITVHEVPQDGHFEFYQLPSSSESKNIVSEKAVSSSLLTLGERFKGIFSKSGTTSGSVDASAQTGLSKKAPRVLDVRISIYPSINGESLVARILNRPDALLSLSDLGMMPDTLATVKKLIARDSGMVLVTGPAGSGKTTVLYSLLQELKSKEKNIMTIEDPVEFHLEWLRQSELKPERGFTFSRAMRSILRQDPDVIMVGEIRDQEAAEHAISVSLIGRIVGSTVHSNSTVGTIARFIDMNIERSMIAYAINGIISRRLVRRICQSCPVEYEPEPAQLSYFGLTSDSQKFFKGKGCADCRDTGYKSRIGIFEVLEFESELRSLIVAKAPMSELEAFTISHGMKTLKQDAVEKVLLGLTTLEEISKIV